MHIHTGQPDEFGGTEPGLNAQEEHRMVTLAGPGGAVWAGQEGLNLGTSQKADEGSVEALGRNSEHSLDELGVLGVAKRGVAEQRMDRGQPGVAGPHTVAPLMLQMVEEAGDQGCVEVGDIELRRRFVRLVSREADEESQ